MPGPIIDFPSEDDEMTALEAFNAEMSAAKDRWNSISLEEVEIAITTAIEALRTGWTTGAGRRLQRFVWSFWNGYHFINLFELSHGLDGRLTDAVIVLFRAAMSDVLIEHQKRRILTESGEMKRWEEAERRTPEHEEVIYPPLPWKADELSKLAQSAQKAERRANLLRR
jgi:hypothetical protein